MAALHSVDQSIKAAVVYNPYRADQIDRHELEYRPGATLADYVGDLGDEAAWSVGYKGEAYFKEDWANIVPAPGEGISLVRVPEGGGGGGKDIMRMVAMIAIAVVAMTVVGPWAGSFFAAGSMAATAASAMAAATFTVAGMMVVNAVMPPAQMTDQTAGGQSYGIDGAKNTSMENVVVPVIFGKYRVAGNIVDYFTKNVGDDQYLFMRVILNDGRVQSIGDFEINDQPIANYPNAQTRIALGTEEGEPNDWFNEAIRLNQVATKLTTGWTTYTTQSDVDRIRLDLLYPGGLGYQKDDGKLLAAESDLRFEYRAAGSTGAFTPLIGSKVVNFLRYEGGAGGMNGVSRPPAFGNGFGSVLKWANFIEQENAADAAYAEGVSYVGQTALAQNKNPVTGVTQATTVGTAPAGAANLTVTGLATVSAADANAARGTYNMTVAYREVGTTAWIVDETHSGSVERSGANDWSQFPLVYRTSTIPVDPSKRWEVTVFNGSLTDATALVPDGNGELHLLLSKKNAFRYSYESKVLPRGRYEVRARRLVAADESNKKRIDEVYLQDVGEIDIENIHYIGTANVSLKIKLGESLSSVSKFTSLVEGSITKQYDEEGNVVSEGFSRWPVWHVLDIFMNQDRGRGIASSRIDFQSAKEWEAHCIEHNLQFNGVFDSESNVWDAVQKLCRVGHASLVRLGTKYAFTVDRKSDPVMLFNDSNIIEGTFTTNWLPMLERANEIQYTFYPEDDNFTEKMIRIVDPDVIFRGQTPKVAKITEEGVTSYAQAQFNVEKQLRENKLIGKTISFDAPIEAIGLVLGDVAAIQHSSASYGKGIGTGRLKAGTTLTTLNLDAPVRMDPAVSYRALLIQSTLKRYTATVQQVTGKHVYVSGLPATLSRCTRLKQGDVETRIVDVIDGSPHDRIVVSDSSGFMVGQTVDLYDTDVIEERDVVVASANEVETVTLASPLSGVPQDHAIWMIGPVNTVKSLFRLREIKGDDTHKRSLTFVQYDDQVYLPLGASVEKPAPTPSLVPPHVQGLNLSYPGLVDGLQTRVTVTLKWTSPDPTYAGADIYMALDSGSWEFVRTVRDVTQIEAEMTIGQGVQFRVVAIGANDRRAPAMTAPVTGNVITPGVGELIRPTDVEVALESFKQDAAILTNWTAVPRTDGNRDTFRVQLYVCKDEAEFEGFILEDGAIPEDAWVSIDTDPDSTEWRTVGATQETYLTIPRLSESKVIVRVRAEYARAVSPYSYAKFDLLAPSLPAGVRNLKLNGILGGTTFTGRDANFSWDDILTPVETPVEVPADGPTDATPAFSEYQWQDYEVSIFVEGSEEPVRKEYTRNPNWTYSFEKNGDDSAGLDVVARRAFRFEVRIRDKAGRTSSAEVCEANNPQQSLIPVNVQRVENTATLIYSQPSVTDFAGIIVFGFEGVGTPTKVIHRGPGSPVIQIPARAPGDPVDAVTLTIRYGFYDAFDDKNLILSAPLALSGAEPIVPEIPDLTEIRDEIDEVRSDGEAVRGQLSNVARDLMNGARTQMQDMLTNVRAAVERDKQGRDNYVAIVETRTVLDEESVKHTEDLKSAVSLLNNNLAAAEERVTTHADAIRTYTERNYTQLSTFEEGIALAREYTATEVSAAKAEATREYTTQSVFGSFQAVSNQRFNALASATEAVADTVDLLGVESADGLSFILNTNKVKIGPNETLAERHSLTEAKFGGSASSYLLQRANLAVSNGQAALDTLTQMGATVGNGSAFQLDANKIRIDGGELLNQRLTSIGLSLAGKTTLSDVDARFDQKITNSIGSGGVISSYLQGSYTTKDQLSATAGILQESINGVKARSSFFVDSNGRIAALNIGSDGTLADMEFLSDRFFFVDNSTGTKMKVLSYSGGKWTFNSAIEIVATSLNVRSATTGRRTEITDSGTNVYDDAGRLRVQLGVW